MRAKEFLKENSDISSDYQKMLDFVRDNRDSGVPADQQVAVALFKELQTQKRQNQLLGKELSAAEKRIDQATRSGELSTQELGMHRAELDREIAAGEKQQGVIGQLDQQYAERDQASQEQIQNLTSQLETIKNTPGISKDAADDLEKQIQELDQNSVSSDKLQGLEQTIISIQSLQTVDDSAIKELTAQVKQAQNTAQELEKTKKSMSQDLDQLTRDAFDSVEQMKQDIARLNQLSDTIAPVAAQVQQLQPQVQSIGAKVVELDSESEDVYNELLNHTKLLNQLTGSTQPVTVARPPTETEIAETRFHKLVTWAKGK